MNKINKPMFDAMVDFLAVVYQSSVTSGRRTAKRNAAVGGKPASCHQDGMAADLVPDNVADRAPLLQAAHRLGLDAVDEGDHIHLEADRRVQ